MLVSRTDSPLLREAELVAATHWNRPLPAYAQWNLVAIYFYGAFFLASVATLMALDAMAKTWEEALR